MRAALDTNVLVYAAGFGVGEDDRAKAMRAGLLIAELSDAGDIVVAAQTLLELFEVLTRKARWPAAATARETDRLAGAFEIVPTDGALLSTAQAIAVEHGFRIFDATILAAADSAGCEVLYSEDMHHGFRWQGVTILDPFRG